MTGRSGAPATVRWQMDAEQATDLAAVLALFEDFLRHGSHEAITELASYQPTRPLDVCRWADWLADYLGDQVITLGAATRHAHTAVTGETR